MPWKLVSFLSILVIITLFIGFNLDNRCDVSIIFYTWKDVPIFVSLLFAYIIGAVTVMPFFIASGSKKRALKKSPSSRTVSVSSTASTRRGKTAKAQSRDPDDFVSGDYDID